jgi:hypothetical protein
MQVIIVSWLIVLTVYVLLFNRTIQKKLMILLHGHSALFWVMKKKKIIDINDWKEDNAVARGEKMSDMSLILHRTHFFHIPPNLVVDQEPLDVETSSSLDFLLLHNLWTMLRR